MSSNQTEFNILGCSVRIKSDDNNTKALDAIDLLNSEIAKVKSARPSLRDSDVAVLSALNLASKCLDTNVEYRNSIFTLKSGIEDALSFIEEASAGSASPQ